MRLSDSIEVKQNLHIIARERGKIVARRDGHNIWLDLGREYLAQLIAYSSMVGPTGERDDRIRYMGLGIGGNRQLLLGIANSEPLLTPYGGTNVQTDSDATVISLERPVRLSGGVGAPSGADVWLGQVQAPAVHPISTQTTFSRIFTSAEINYGPFLSVPLSEVMLYPGAANVNVYNNPGIAYDTFDSITKTTAFELEVNWTIRF